MSPKPPGVAKKKKVDPWSTASGCIIRILSAAKHGEKTPVRSGGFLIVESMITSQMQKARECGPFCFGEGQDQPKISLVMLLNQL